MPARERESAPARETMIRDTVVKQAVCKVCTEIAGEIRFRVPDKKGVHKCQICRSEMTAEYAAKLPGIKDAMRKERERPR